MTPAQFKTWRKNLGLKQKDAAELLGLKKRVIQYYERGKRDGKSVGIPKTVELACYALSQGIGGYDGEEARAVDIDIAPQIANGAAIIDPADPDTDDLAEAAE